MFKSALSGERVECFRHATPCRHNKRFHQKAVCQFSQFYYPVTQYTTPQGEELLQKNTPQRKAASQKQRPELPRTRINRAPAEKVAKGAAEAQSVDKVAFTDSKSDLFEAKPRTKRQRKQAVKPSEAEQQARPSTHEVLSDVEVQLLDRKASSASASSKTGWSAEAYTATELIFKLERRGEGWGEEIFPHMTVEKRPLTSVKTPPKRNRGDRPDPWEEGSPEWFLRDHCRIPEDQVDAVMTTATAWRVTPGGRPLIDRRRRSRVARNLGVVTEYLEKLGVPPGQDGLGKVYIQAPQLMLCKPTANDRWDRRAVELAAFLYHNGDCNVSEDDEDMHDLAVWVKRQRTMWQQGILLQDRMQILGALGFEVGTEAQVTEEWEYRFDQLVEWLLLMGAHKLDPKSDRGWLGLDWGLSGSLRGRECCIWAQLQRELRRRNLLPTDAVRRLESLNFPWETQGGTETERRWMHAFGRLVFSIERCLKLSNVASSASLPQFHRANANAEALAPAAPQAQADDSLLQGQHSDSWLLGEEDGLGLEEYAWIQQEVIKRREALQAAELEPGQRFWLAKQQRAWRLGRLSREQTLLLRLLGVEFDADSLENWRQKAHKAAAFLLGSQLLPEIDGFQRSSSTASCHQSPSGNRQPHDYYETRQNQDYLFRSSHCNGSSSARGLVAGSGKAIPGQRLRVERWVLTQQASYAESRLSMAQIRYLALLELSWLLNKDSIASSKLLWEEKLQQLTVTQLEQCFGSGSSQDEATQEWLLQQRALHALGWLEKENSARLQELGVDLLPCRSADDLDWERHLTELLAFRREFGHCRLPPGGWPAASELQPWLAEKQHLWRRNKLPAKRLAQLSALGIDRRTIAEPAE